MKLPGTKSREIDVFYNAFKNSFKLTPAWRTMLWSVPTARLRCKGTVTRRAPCAILTCDPLCRAFKNPSRSSAFTASAPKHREAVSHLNQDRIADEVDPDAPRSFPFIEVDRNSFRDLLLQIAEVHALRGDAARSGRIVPPRDEKTRLFVALDLQRDLFHGPALIISQRGGQKRYLISSGPSWTIRNFKPTPA